MNRTSISENPYLKWILRHRAILSLSALDEFLGLRAQCLQQFVSYGSFPEKYLPNLEAKLKPVVQLNEGVFWVEYCMKLIKRRRQLLQELDDYDGAPAQFNRVNIADAKQQQCLDDLYELYITAAEHFPNLQPLLYNLLQPEAPELFKSLPPDAPAIPHPKEEPMSPAETKGWFNKKYKKPNGDIRRNCPLGPGEWAIIDDIEQTLKTEGIPHGWTVTAANGKGFTYTYVWGKMAIIDRF